MSDLYILDTDGRTPKKIDSVYDWGKAREKQNRIVAKTLIREVKVSTVFLGLDHGFINAGHPILFETMVFGGEHDGFMNRYSTWEEAEKGHNVICEMIVNL